MVENNPSQTLPDGSIEPAHQIEIVCGQCGYDLDKEEISADTCADCGNELNLRQSIAIQVTTIPAASGATM